MREYNIVPEFAYSKTFLLAATICQFVAIGFVVLGYYVTAVSYLAAAILQLSFFYFLCLYLCNRNYRLRITPIHVTVWNLFNKSKQHMTCQIRWKIKRIPWYNTYFVVLYSTSRMPVAILKPHWENVWKILKLPHYGAVSIAERKYIEFLKSVGLMH